jgi:hypothetical protein
MSNSIFTYLGYQDFLEHLKQLGNIMLFRDWDGSNAYLLRHDIDVDIVRAHRLAAIENESDVCSTYFILTTCSTYNVAAARERRLLKEISDNGHEIALHFDPTIYGDIPKEEMQKKVELEASQLEDIIQRKVKSVSLHNPSVHGQFPEFEGFNNAYNETIFSDEHYISDSQRKFRGKDPYLFVLGITKRPIQINFHPIHFSENGDDYSGIFTTFESEWMKNIDDMFKINATYNKEVEGGLVDHVKSTNP